MKEENLERLFSESQAKADVRLAFGESREIGEKTIIPIASVAWGGGFGFGTETDPSSGAEAAAAARQAGGGGQGGGFRVRPMAVLEVSSSETKLRAVVDSTSIALAGIILGGWNVYWITRTLQAIFRK